MIEGNLIKVIGWYDNEWGYSNRCVELAGKVLGLVAAGSGPVSRTKASVRDAEVGGPAGAGASRFQRAAGRRPRGR